MILDVPSLGTEEPWCMMFADDLGLCSPRIQEIKRQLEEWRTEMEEQGLNISGKMLGMPMYIKTQRSFYRETVKK